jgi:hypothetical protein
VGMQEVDFGDWMVSVASMSRTVNRVAPEIRRKQANGNGGAHPVHEPSNVRAGARWTPAGAALGGTKVR